MSFIYTNDELLALAEACKLFEQLGDILGKVDMVITNKLTVDSNNNDGGTELGVIGYDDEGVFGYTPSHTQEKPTDAED